MAISRKVLVVQSWLTPHFVRNMHVSISVSYILCPSEQQNWLKSRFYAQMAQFGLYLGRNQWEKTKSSILTEITHFNQLKLPETVQINSIYDYKRYKVHIFSFSASTYLYMLNLGFILAEINGKKTKSLILTEITHFNC